MSMRRRSAKRFSDNQSPRQVATQELPELDRAFVIAFLQIDPEVAAALNGEVATPPVVESAPLEPHQLREVEIVNAATQPADGFQWEQEPQIIETAGSLEAPLGEAEISEPAASPPRSPKVSRVTVRKPARAPKARKSRREPRRRAAVPAPETKPETLEELVHPDRTQEWAAAATEVSTPTAQPMVAQAQPVSPAQEAPPAAPAVAQPPAQPRHLPVEYIDHQRLMAQVAQVGWKIPPARRLQWDYMNFVMPPNPMANMTPKQQARQEWRNMLKYYRINPYKSHWRQDRKEAKRLLSQLRRARLDVA